MASLCLATLLRLSPFRWTLHLCFARCYNGIQMTQMLWISADFSFAMRTVASLLRSMLTHPFPPSFRALNSPHSALIDI